MYVNAPTSAKHVFMAASWNGVRCWGGGEGVGFSEMGGEGEGWGGWIEVRWDWTEWGGMGWMDWGEIWCARCCCVVLVEWGGRWSVVDEVEDLGKAG